MQSNIVRAWLVAGGVFTFAAGCGGGASVSLDNFSSELAQGYCAKLFECCTDQEITQMFERSPVTDEASCRSLFQGFVEAVLVTQIRASQNSGKLTYEGGRVADCLDTLAAMSCPVFAKSRASDDSFAGCEQPVVGNVAPGSACAWDLECQTGYCEGDQNGQNGTCKDLPANGQPCPDFDCASGFYCEFGPGGSTCAPQKDNGATCSDDDECKSGFCSTGGGGSGTCADANVCDGR